MNTGLKSFFSAALIILFFPSQAVGRGEGEFRGNERESPTRRRRRVSRRRTRVPPRRRRRVRGGERGSPGRGGEGEYRGGGEGEAGRGGEGFTNRSSNDHSPSFNPSRSNAYDRPYPSFNSGAELA